LLVLSGRILLDKDHQFSIGKRIRELPCCVKRAWSPIETRLGGFCYKMGVLKAFISSPSRNHLVISDSCIDRLKYVDVGLEVSTFIEDKIGDRRLSMRVQDHLNIILRSHICKSEDFGEYLALKNIGILFEPLLKIDLEGFLDRWSQNMMLILDVDKGIIRDNHLYLSQGCSNDYAVSLEGVNYIELL